MEFQCALTSCALSYNAIPVVNLRLSVKAAIGICFPFATATLESYIIILHFYDYM